MKRIVEKIFYPVNNYNSFQALPKNSYLYASLLATKIKTCVYTNRVLPQGLMLRFIKAYDEESGTNWLVSDGIYGSKRGGKGIWLKCSQTIINSFISENIYKRIEKKIFVRKDMCYHIYYLFNLSILNMFKTIDSSLLKTPNQLDLEISCYITLTPQSNNIEESLEAIKYPKDFILPSIPINYLEGLPFFNLNELLHPNILAQLSGCKSLIPYLSRIRKGSSICLGICMHNDTLKLVEQLYRFSLFLKE